MAMKLTAAGMWKGMAYTGIALVGLGILKTAAPDVWAKIPGLKEF